MDSVRSVKSIRAAKTGYIIISAALCLTGLFFILFPAPAARLLNIICGTAFSLFGLIKMIGYFSRDLYRLAFQHDLALGILLMLIGGLMLLRPGNLISFISAMTGISVLCDGLFKIQTAVDSKCFGIGRWRVILILALLSCASGLFLLCRPYEGGRIILILLGISLILEGLLNLSVAIYALKIITHQRPDDLNEYDE